MIGAFQNFIQIVVRQRFLILAMAKRDITAQYVGSLLGVIWTIIHPLVLIFVFWFVLSESRTLRGSDTLSLSLFI